MNKYFMITILTLALCFTALPSKAYAQQFDGSVHYGKTTTHSTTTTEGWHKTTDTTSRSHGAWGEAHIDGVSGSQLKGFYNNFIKPYAKHANNNNTSYQYSYTPSSYSPPHFSQPSFSTPSFHQPSMPSMPSAPHFGGF